MQASYAAALLFAVLPMVAFSQACEDTDAQCSYWAETGQCAKNPIWMKPNCAKSCNECRPQAAWNTPQGSALRQGIDFLEFTFAPDAKSPTLVGVKTRIFKYPTSVIKYLNTRHATMEQKVFTSTEDAAKNYAAEMSVSASADSAMVGIPAGTLEASVSASAELVYKTSVKTFRSDTTIKVEKGKVVFGGRHSVDYLLPWAKKYLMVQPVQKIVDRFGILVPQQVIMGAIFKMTIIQERKKSDSENTFKAEASAAVDLLVKKASFKVGVSSSGTFSKSKNTYHVLVQVQGGDPEIWQKGLSMEESRKEWGDSLKGDNGMTAICFKMIPIWDLVSALGADQRAKELKDYVLNKFKHIGSTREFGTILSTTTPVPIKPPCTCLKTHALCSQRSECRWDINSVLDDHRKKGRTFDKCKNAIMVETGLGWVHIPWGQERLLSMKGKGDGNFYWRCEESGRRRWFGRRRADLGWSDEGSYCGGGDLLKVHAGRRRRFEFECFQSRGGACDVKSHSWGSSFGQEPHGGCPVLPRLMEADNATVPQKERKFAESPALSKKSVADAGAFRSHDIGTGMLPLLVVFIMLALAAVAASVGLVMRRRRRPQNQSRLIHTLAPNDDEVEDTKANVGTASMGVE